MNNKFNYIKDAKPGATRQKQSRSSRLNKARSTAFSNQVNHLLKWLLKNFIGMDPGWYSIVQDYLIFINHLFENKGPSFAIKVNKDVRLNVTKFLASEYYPGSVGLKLTHDGIPCRLRGLIPLLRSKDPGFIRFLMTVLMALRRITVPPQPDIDSIKNPYTGTVDQDFARQYVKGFRRNLRKLKIYPKQLRGWERYHLSTKSGPSSKQALYSCLDDLVLLPTSLLDSLAVLGGPDLADRMKLLLSQVDLVRGIMKQSISGSTSFRKLSYIPDSEGKTRVVAIGDYWSQSCLRPLHDNLYRVLRMIPQDQTFDQSAGLSSLPLDGSTTYYCFDLKSATDRFPIYMNKLVLEMFLTKEEIVAWHDIMVGYPFDYKTSKGPESVYYTVGNPMGFYTSWSSFALSHHFVLYICCTKLGISWINSKYKLLGDDIIIYDDRLASEYLEQMKLLGVEISLSKTHRSNHFFEFAKRYFIPGGEVSPLSIKACLVEGKSIAAFIQLLGISYRRGFVPTKGIEHCAFEYFSTKPGRWRNLPALRRNLNTTHLLYRRLLGFASDLELINNVLVTKHLPSLSCNQRHIAEAVLIGAVVRTFEKSVSRFSGDCYDRLYHGLLLATSDENPDVSVELIYAHPFTYVYGLLVEQAYLDQMQKAYDFDTLMNGKWLPNLRVLKAADASSILRSRNYAVVPSAVPILLRSLRDAVAEMQLHP